MPSKLFYSTRTKLATKELASTLGSTFKAKARVQTGTYLGRNRILVDGQEYQFTANGNTSVSTGDTIQVENIGRKAAAIYSPTDLPKGVGGGSGGGSSAAASALITHTHDGDDTGGNTITVDPSVWNFILENVSANLQATLNRIDSRGMMEKQSVDSGDTLTVPTNYSMVVVGPYSVVGTLNMIGVMQVL